MTKVKILEARVVELEKEVEILKRLVAGIQTQKVVVVQEIPIVVPVIGREYPNTPEYPFWNSPTICCVGVDGVKTF